MKRFRPLLASLTVSLLALGMIYVWTRPASAPPGAPIREDEPDSDNDTEIAWKTVELDDRPTLDPTALWPRAGMRMAHPEVWVSWRTADLSESRLMARTSGTAWYDLGRTTAVTHFLPLDISRFDGSAVFKVDFEDGGRKYRSSPQDIRFGAGAFFTRRRYRFEVEPGTNEFPLRLQGRDPGRLGSGAFVSSQFPPDVVCYVVPLRGDENGGEMRFGIQDGATVPAAGCAGFLEVRDRFTRTYDRILIEIFPAR